VRGENASEIKEEIEDADEMNYLSFLTDAEIQAIADVLATTTTPPPAPPVPSDGIHPYGWDKLHPDYVDRNGMSACKTCHGQDLRGGTGPSCFSCHSDDDDDGDHDGKYRDDDDDDDDDHYGKRDGKHDSKRYGNREVRRHRR